MLAQKKGPASTDRQARAYQQAGEYIISPASCDGNDWQVIKNTGQFYTVDVAAGTCDCPDFRKRGGKCKHQHLVSFHLEAEAPAPKVEAPQPARRTFSAEEKAALLSLWD